MIRRALNFTHIFWGVAMTCALYATPVYSADKQLGGVMLSPPLTEMLQLHVRAVAFQKVCLGNTIFPEMTLDGFQDAVLIALSYNGRILELLDSVEDRESADAVAPVILKLEEKSYACLRELMDAVDAYSPLCTIEAMVLYHKSWFDMKKQIRLKMLKLEEKDYFGSEMLKSTYLTRTMFFFGN